MEAQKEPLNLLPTMNGVNSTETILSYQDEPIFSYLTGATAGATESFVVVPSN